MRRDREESFPSAQTISAAPGPRLVKKERRTA
jgi:hypothetical protein